MTLILNGNDITSLCRSLTLSRDCISASAVLKAELIFENNDGYLPPVSAENAMPIVLKENEAPVFDGVVIETETIGREGIFVLTAFEKSHSLAKCFVSGIFMGSAKNALAKAFSQVGAEVGQCPEVYFTPFSSMGGLTAFDVFKGIYGKEYFTVQNKRKIDILKKGKSSIAIDPSSLLGISSDISALNIVNDIVLQNTKGQIVYRKSSPYLLNKYGRMTKYYTVPQASDFNSFAQSHLKGEAYRADVTFLGGFEAVIGAKTDFDLKKYGLFGTYLIESVFHSVRDGIHTVKIRVTREEK